MHALYRTVFASVLVLAVTACGDSNDDVGVVEPPLGILNTFPLDLPSPYTGTNDLAVNFTRATGVHEMQVSIFPPAVAGTFSANTETRTNWTWHDVQFETDAGCYFWLIDGIRLGRYYTDSNDQREFRREPVVIRIPTPEPRLFSVGFGGLLTSPVAGLSALGSIVFALPSATTTFNPLDPGSFDATEAVAVVVAERDDDFIDQPGRFRFTHLPIDTAYVVVAIKDTNRDLYYDPTTDWWGFFEDAGGPANVLSKLDTGEKDSEFNFRVDFNLRQPVPDPEPPAD